HRGVAVGLRIVGQKLVSNERAVGAACDHVGKGAAAVDPKVPAAVRLHGAPCLVLLYTGLGARGEASRRLRPKVPAVGPSGVRMSASRSQSRCNFRYDALGAGEVMLRSSGAGP